jgi:hypothetical protein
MWKQLYEWAKELVFLSQDTQRNRADIRDLREEMDRLTSGSAAIGFRGAAIRRKNRSCP